MDNNKPIGVLILILLIILCGVYLLIVDETPHQTENNKINNTTTGTISNNSTNISTNITNNTTISDINNTNDSNVNPGDIIQKKVFTVKENEKGQNEGMEPGTYIIYYTANDGPLKIEKIK